MNTDYWRPGMEPLSMTGLRNPGDPHVAPTQDFRSHVHPRNWKITAVFLLILAVLEYAVFSRSLSQFFQGDALFWMLYRFRSWSEFFQSLVSLDVANWYRPLSNRTIPALFFPWFGLDPYGYHWVILLVFFTETCLVFFFLRKLVESFVTAAAGAVFVGIHSINVYLTYDFAFAPELFYASFYLSSCIAFLRGSESRRWRLFSVLFFILALMSKEAAVTLPANIILLSLYAYQRVKKSVLPYWGILAIYYIYVVLFLKVGAGDYSLAFHKDICRRIGESLLWAMNLGRGRMDYATCAVALLVGIYAITSILGSRRRIVVFGLCWFIVALSPMLGIVGGFGPYYLFLSLVGIGLIVGELFSWLFMKLASLNRPTAVAGVCVGLLPFMVAAYVTTGYELRTNSALGYAGYISEKSIFDLKRLHPSLPKGATIYIENSSEPDLWRFYGLGALFKLFYSDDSLDVRYSSLGHTVPEELLDSGGVIAAKYENMGLTYLGKSVLPKSEQLFQYQISDRFKLEVFPTQVRAGKDFYTIRVTNAANADAVLQYHFNDGPLAFITVHLNPKGDTRFFVSKETKRGTYRFVGLRILPNIAWIRVNGTVLVTD